MYTQYINNEEKRIKEVIPGIFDLIFKAIFTSEREYLADIISGITEIPKKIVEEKALILNSEYVIENIEKSKKTSDLVIEVENNIINIEMNRSYYEGLVKRNNKYVQKLSYINSNDKTIIQINFNMFNLYNDNRTIIKFEMMDKERGLVDKRNITKYEVNIELIYKKYYNKKELTELEKRLLMLVLKNREELRKVSNGDELMEKINKKLEDLSDDKYAWMIYDREERMKEEAKLVAEYEVKKEMKEKFKKEEEKLKKKEEKLKKKEEKLKIKSEKEISKKVEMALKEGSNNRNIEIAKNMLKDNTNVEMISKYTGLSIEKIELLK